VAALRAGIVGGGWIARRHVPGIDAAADVELVAACDADLARAELIAGPRGARAYERWEDMLAGEELDVLWICPPPLAHREPAVAALDAGIHVYLEKPIARTSEDAQAIAAAAARSQAVCAVGYQWHATELLDDIREATAGQPIGMLTGRNYGPVAARPWFMTRAEGGGQILERGSHHIDLQRAIAGEIDAVEAVAGGARLAQAGGSGGDIEDVMALALHFRSGALGTVNMAWTRDGQPELYALDLLAGDATLWVELGPDRFRVRGSAGGRELDVEHDDPFDRSVARFLEAVRDGDRSSVFCKPDDALRTLVVAQCCEQALAEGGRVRVPAGRR
jgi:myo-inositol 2-dehydrogenase / D-chiro-inositol 1-dehydrogenase